MPISYAESDPKGVSLALFTEIGQMLSSSLDLRESFLAIMDLLSRQLNLRRGTLVLLDEATGKMRIVAAHGLMPSEVERGVYALGEGVTGIVVATGKPKVVFDIAADPDFLNRTQSREPELAKSRISFVCVPVRAGGKTIGAMSVDRVDASEAQLEWDTAFLGILGAFLAQAIQMNRSVMQQKELLLEENRRLRGEVREKYRFENIIGDSSAMQDVLATVAQVADSRATVMILGETGTGKEMVARAIHFNSSRRDKPFVCVNCGALSASLLESELFGHEKGSFTGAIRDKIGRFEAADTGTLFLDEIATVEPQLQVKLLRAIQEREFERVGGTRTLKVDVRLIAATNADLQEEVARGKFREDLYYRLNVVTLYLPPLRNRPDDIPPLIDHFLNKYNSVNGRSLGRISRETLSILRRYPWPGNVRELENAIERAVVLSRNADFTEDLLPLPIRMFVQQRKGEEPSESVEVLSRRLAEQSLVDYELREGQVYPLVIDQVEKHLVELALERCAGVKSRAADFLGLNRNTLNKKVKDLGINAHD